MFRRRRGGSAADDPATDAAASHLIDLRGVVKDYVTDAGAFRALDTIDLQVDPGEFVAVVGRSGCGKSTLMNMITGIDRATDGVVRVAGQDLAVLSEGKVAEWRGRTIGVVFQFFQLLPTLTVVENVMLPMDFGGHWRPSEREGRAMDLLDRVGMADQAASCRPARRAASSSGSPSPGRSPTTRRSSSRTSRPATSIRSPPTSSSTSSGPWSTAAGPSSWSPTTPTSPRRRGASSTWPTDGSWTAGSTPATTSPPSWRARPVRSVRWRKVVRDLGTHKLRTVLVVALDRRRGVRGRDHRRRERPAPEQPPGRLRGLASPLGHAVPRAVRPRARRRRARDARRRRCRGPAEHHGRPDDRRRTRPGDHAQRHPRRRRPAPRPRHPRIGRVADRPPRDGGRTEQPAPRAVRRRRAAGHPDRRRAAAPPADDRHHPRGRAPRRRSTRAGSRPT